MLDDEPLLLDRDALLQEVSASGELSAGDDVFFITEGRALIRADSVLSSGLSATQTFAAGEVFI